MASFDEDVTPGFVARALVRAGQSQNTGQALLTTGAGRWRTLSPDKVTLSSLPVANKVTHRLILVVGKLISTRTCDYEITETAHQVSIANGRSERE